MIARPTKRTKGAALSVGLLVAMVALALPILRVWPAGEDTTTPAVQRDVTKRTAAASREVSPTATQPPAAVPPRDKEMTLDVPALKRVDGIRVETALGTEEAPLRDGALHVAGTGFPWQEGVNVYIAGHRVGFPGTKSSLLFWDLDELRSGDAVILHDSDERRYEYRVFARRTVDPLDISVTDPVPGKSVVSLQTCTLPDYARRLVVQAELVSAPPDTAAGAPMARYQPDKNQRRAALSRGAPAKHHRRHILATRAGPT
jgi:sortase A